MFDLVRSVFARLRSPGSASREPDEEETTESDRTEDHQDLRAAADRLKYSSAWSDVEIETIKQGLSHPAPPVRSFAAETITDMPTAAQRRRPDLVSALVEHLEDDPSVRRNSARALGAIAAADPEAISDHVPKLADYLSAHNIHVIKGIGTALSEATEEAPGDIVEAVAEYLDPEVRYPTRDQAVAAAAAAARVDPSTVEPHLADLIDLARAGCPDRGRYVEALAPLAEAYPARVAPVVPTILTCLREGDDEERAASVETLSSVVVAGEAAQHLDEVATLLTEYLGAEEPSRAGEALDALAAAIEHESEVSDRIAETLEDMKGQKKVRVAQRLVESGARCLDATAQDGLSHSRLRQFID